MANNSFQDTVDSLFRGADGFLAAKSVVGEPIKIGETIIIPLADVSFGIGAGAFGGENKNNDGGGIGGKMTPCAVLIIQNGSTRLVNIRQQDSLAKALDMVPDLVNRFMPGGGSADDEEEE